MMARTGVARLFRNGRSQAVRLPQEFRFEGDRVRVRRVAGGVLLEPFVADTATWFEELDRWAAEPFPVERKQPKTPRRKILQVNYLLDINACIALINGKPSSVRSRFRRATAEGGNVYIPSIVVFELWYGVAKSSQPETNRQRLAAFLAGPIAPLAFDDDDAKSAGAIRAALEAVGKPIGAYDLLIAGQALQRRFTLVTANVKGFARVKGLAWQDWS